MSTVAHYHDSVGEHFREASVNTSVQWHVLWTHSNCESAVYDELTSKGYELLFARIHQWTTGRQGKYLACVPMFRSYLFIHEAIGKHEYIDVCKTRGLVRILGDSWDKLAVIPDHEIQQIKSVCNAGVVANSYPYLKHGDKVRVIRGSLKNTEGILVRNDLNSGLLVVSVNLLNRSLAVQINCTDVVPV